MRFWFLSTSVISLGFAGCILTPPEFGNRDDNTGYDTGEGFVRGSGSAEFAWQVGAAGCEAAGVEQVEVTIGSTERAFDCEDGRGSMQVQEGFYKEVFARGLDLEGVARYEGRLVDVQIFEGSNSSLGTFRLEARTGEIETTWRFDNGELCGPNGVVELDIALLQANRIQQQVFTTCDDGIELIANVVAGAYEISMLANDTKGFPQYRADAEVTVIEGELTRVDLVLAETN